MKIAIAGLSALLAASLLAPAPQGTPAPMAACYDSLADSILAIKQTEANFVRSLLDGHFHAAKAYMDRGDTARAAAEMALFANEGDNAIGGVRKRLLEGGHHHHADGEAKGIYEPGFVVVTRKAKQEALAASAALQQAKTDDERKQVWETFASIAHDLLGA